MFGGEHLGWTGSNVEDHVNNSQNIENVDRLIKVAVSTALCIHVIEKYKTQNVVYNCQSVHDVDVLVVVDISHFAVQAFCDTKTIQYHFKDHSAQDICLNIELAGVSTFLLRTELYEYTFTGGRI